jgi:hypothetical protein
MPYYLTTYVGTGTRKDPFRPFGSDQPGWTGIDLRPDASVADGFTIVFLPQPVSDLRLEKLSDHKDESISSNTTNSLKNKLDPAIDRATTKLTVARLLRQPPTGKWNPIKPVGMRTGQPAYEIWLGNERIYHEPIIRGGASDNFERADENPLANGPWKSPGSSGLTAPNAFKLDDGAVCLVSPTGDNFALYDGAASTDDQYSEADQTGILSNDWAVVVRMNPVAGGGGTLFNAYAYFEFGANLAKFVDGGFSIITSYSVSGGKLRLEVEGSTLRAYEDDVLEGTPQTDSSHTSGLVGFFIFEDVAAPGNGVLFWEGGDLGEESAAGLRYGYHKFPKYIVRRV